MKNDIATLLVILANLTSIFLWIPQARSTWAFRKNPDVLSGISYGTLILAASNTCLWGGYGLLIHNYGLAFATCLILPTTSFTLWLKINTRKNLQDVESRQVLTREDIEEDIEEDITSHYDDSFLTREGALLNAAEDLLGQISMIKNVSHGRNNTVNSVSVELEAACKKAMSILEVYPQRVSRDKFDDYIQATER